MTERLFVRHFVMLAALIFGTLLSAFQSSFLMPDEAFKPKAQLLDNQHIQAEIGLGEGIYIYKDRLDVEVKEPSGVSVQNVNVLTESEAHDGDMVYMKDVLVDIALASNAAGARQKVVLELGYQGCSEKGLCYEPQTKSYTFDIDFSKALPGETKSVETATDTAGGGSETDIIVDTLKTGSIWAILILFFGFGFALSMTPCIFPMIPILSSIIVSQGEGLSARRGFMLSLVYVLAMAVAYSIAGVLAGLFGENLQVMLQNPWAIGGFALVFVALAFSMFGFYEIGLPASLQTRISRVSDEAGERGGFIGVAAMGFLSALIVGPCVAPGLAAALIYIGQTGNAALGGAALFIMSLGMGIPLLLIGLGAGRFMPKPGGWMDTLTKTFGAIMIGIAIWMASRVIPESITMLLWALFFMIASIYMGALEPLGERRSWNALFKAVGVVSLVYGSILFVGVLTGGTSLTQPLKGFESSPAAAGSPAAKPSDALRFDVIHSKAELDEILAKSKGKKVMLDFSAQWCSACKEYEEITFADPAVISALERFVLVQADVTENSDKEKALTKQFGLFGPPGIIFFDEKGEVMASKTVVGFQPPEKFLAHLKGL